MNYFQMKDVRIIIQCVLIGLKEANVLNLQEKITCLLIVKNHVKTVVQVSFLYLFGNL